MAHLTMAENGRVLIPAEFRAALGLKEGGAVVVRMEDGALVVEALEASIRRVQDSMKQYAKPGKSLVDELLTERRQEAERE